MPINNFKSSYNIFLLILLLPWYIKYRTRFRLILSLYKVVGRFVIRYNITLLWMEYLIGRLKHCLVWDQWIELGEEDGLLEATPWFSSTPWILSGMQKSANPSDTNLLSKMEGWFTGWGLWSSEGEVIGNEKLDWRVPPLWA